MENVTNEMVRLSKLLSEQGLCSRREADAYIEKGWVFVNGIRVNQLGTKVTRDAEVRLAPEARRDQDTLVTVMLNKPVGYVSAQPEEGYTPAIKLLTSDRFFGQDLGPTEPISLRGLAPTGRLDIESQGLLIFTQDGRLAQKILAENSEIEKEYIVRVKGELSIPQLKLLRHGMSLDEKPLKPAHVEWVNEDQLRFVLKEGRKRQIRRMCEQVGLHVTGLKRVRIGNLRLGQLPEGEWRYINPEDILG